MAPTVAAALLVVVGCTYSEREPGLLDRDTPQPTVGPSSSKSPHTAAPLPAANPELPVAGEAVTPTAPWPLASDVWTVPLQPVYWLSGWACSSWP